MTDVAAVAMTNQNCNVATPRICDRRKMPRTQSHAVFRDDCHVLEWAIQIAGRRFPVRGGMVNLLMFKTPKHQINLPQFGPWGEWR